MSERQPEQPPKSISFASLGPIGITLDQTLAPFEVARTILFKRLVFSVWAIVAFYSCFFGWLQITVNFWACALGALVLSPLTLGLEGRKYHNLARLFFIFSCNFYIYVASLGLAHRVAAEYYYLPTIMIPLLVFDRSKKIEITISIAFSLVLWWASVYFGTGIIPSSLIALSAPFDLIKNVNFAGAFLISLAFLSIFKRTSFQLQDLLIEQVSREADRHRSITHTMNEALIIQDENGKIIFHNPATLAILGASEDQVLGQIAHHAGWHRFHENGMPYTEDENPSLIALRTGKPVLGAIMGLKLPGKETRWLRINANPSNLIGKKSVVVTFSDITELIQTKNETRFILDALQIGIWKYDPLQNKLTWDNSMFELYGIAPDEFTGDIQAWEACLTPECRTATTAEFFAAIRGDQEFNTTFKIRTKTGSVRSLKARAKVTRNEKNEPTMMYGINMDRSNEANNEAQLERQNVMIESVLNNLPNMVFVKDFQKNLSFSFFNKSGEDLLGVKAKDLIGKSDYDLVPKEQADQFVAADRQVFQTHQPMQILKESIQTPKGERWLRTYKVPTYTKAGEPDLLIGISTDITEELELQKKLDSERAKSTHNAKMASLGELSAGIAHEINNPLAIISGTIPLLERFKNDPEKFSSKCEVLMKSTNRIAKIVKGLRKYSRSSEGSVHKLETLKEILDEALIITEAKAKRHQTAIELHLRSQSKILCDSLEIEQVLINLINNGIDAVKTTSERWIKINTFDEIETSVIQVIDSGSGITPEIEQKLFQPFFTTKSVGEGTGLGLSITKGILDQHQATLTLNRNFKNTCFEIRFPHLLPVTDETPLAELKAKG